MGWIGVDLDGTLALWGPGFNESVLEIGEPIAPMVERVKSWLAELIEVRIVTARVGPATDAECLTALAGLAVSNLVALCGETILDASVQEVWDTYQRRLIERWCEQHLGGKLRITATKDFHMWQLWDDRCIQVLSNTGEPVLAAMTQPGQTP